MATWRKQNLATENKKNLDVLSEAFEDHKKDTSKEFSKVNKGIDDILNKLDKQG